MLKKEINKLTISAICLALCMYLPFLTGQIQSIGEKLSPMHIPVFLCGFLCGARYAAIVGAVAPLMRFMFFGMPPLPIGMAMSFELLTYGIVAALLYHVFPKKACYIYLSLILSMLVGRIVWGVVMWRISDLMFDVPFTFRAFLDGAFLLAWPGIVLHIAVVPPIVVVLKKAIPNTH